ncbi:hypothetical protein ACMFY5_25185, partial [Pseudomonas sihuiensis]
MWLALAQQQALLTGGASPTQEGYPMHRFTLSMCGLAVAAAFSQTALASQQSEAQGFIQDSSFNLLNRAFYFNRDFRNGGFNG